MTHEQMKESLLAKLSERVYLSRLPPLLAAGPTAAELLAQELGLVVQRIAELEYPTTDPAICSRLAKEVSHKFVQDILDREARKA
jgi:hypothetical protein